VGPVWGGGKRKEEDLLRNCYRNSLSLAEKSGAKSVAFPSISTGAYRFPIETASRVAVQTVVQCLKEMRTVGKVIFVCFSRRDYEIYRKAIREVPASDAGAFL